MIVSSFVLRMKPIWFVRLFQLLDIQSFVAFGLYPLTTFLSFISPNLDHRACWLKLMWSIILNPNIIFSHRGVRGVSRSVQGYLVIHLYFKLGFSDLYHQHKKRVTNPNILDLLSQFIERKQLPNLSPKVVKYFFSSSSDTCKGYVCSTWRRMQPVFIHKRRVVLKRLKSCCWTTMVRTHDIIDDSIIILNHIITHRFTIWPKFIC